MRRLFLLAFAIVVALAFAACIPGGLPPVASRASAASVLVVTINGAPRFVRAQSANSNGPSIGVTVGFPTVNVNDDMICAVAYGQAQDVVSIGAPTGFTQIGTPPDNAQNAGLAVFVHRIASGESSGHYSFNINGSGGLGTIDAACQEWSFVDPLNPVLGIALSSTYGSGLATTPTFYAPVIGTQAAAFFADDETQVGGANAQTGWTQDGYQSNGITLESQHNDFPAPSLTTRLGAGISWSATTSHYPISSIVLLNPIGGVPGVAPTPSTTPTATAIPTPIPTRTAPSTPTSFPTVTPIVTASPSPTPLPTVPSTPTPSPTPMPTATATPTPTATPTATPSPTATPTPTATPSPTIAPTNAPVPTPSPYVTPTPLASAPTHMLTYVQGNATYPGCYFAPAGANGCSQGYPPVPSAYTSTYNSKNTIYRMLSKYVNYLEVTLQNSNDAHNAGIVGVQYTDPHQLNCNNDLGIPYISAITSAQGVTDINGALVYLPGSNSGNCGSTPDFPNGSSGSPSPSETPVSGTVYGNIGSPSLRALEDSAITRITAADQYNPAPQGIGIIRNDDAEYYGYNSFSMCAGFPTYAQYQMGCTAPSLSSNPYFQSSMTQNWVNDEVSLYQSEGYTDSSGNFHQMNAIFNDLTAPDKALYFAATNLVGGQCENCLIINPYAGTNVYQPESSWVRQLNAGLAAIELGRFIDYFRTDVASPSDESYLYASLLLIDNDPRYVAVSEELYNGATAPSAYAPSGAVISPWIYLVPSQPTGVDITLPAAAWGLGTYTEFNPMPNVGVAKLKDAGGAYVRYFAKCFNKGTSFGACGSVVNPTSSTVSISSLTSGFTHTCVVSGHGVVTEFGDTGTLTCTGTAPPPSSLLPHTGVILSP